MIAAIYARTGTDQGPDKPKPLDNLNRFALFFGVGGTSAMPPRKKKNPHAVALGRLGGQVGGRSRSAAKVKAVRENGKRGGRPPKTKRSA